MKDFRIEDHTGEAIRALAEVLPVALEEIGLHLEGEAKEELSNSPKRIDTGLLRNSITHGLGGQPPAITSYKGDKPRDGSVPSGSYSGTLPGDDLTVYIGTNVEYAPYIHEGTDGLAPNRFLKNAVMKNKDQVKDRLRQAMEDA